MSDGQARSSGFGSLFSELRRRKVLRSSAIYIGASWLLIQVVELMFDIFDIPEVYTRYVTVALFAGFPVAVILSWIFDIGPLIRTPDVGDSAEHGQSGLDQVEAYTLSDSAAPAKSIAVMPFANVGKDPENEFFSDGIAEELLNLLNKVPKLKVAARTSSFAFRETRADARSVAQRLGVRHLLEGSVRRAAERVRISAQLIDADTGFTLWSSSFDRDLHDIFAVQDEIAASIVYALEEALDEALNEAQSAEGPLREVAPTENIESYQLYLRGLYLWQRRGETAIRGAIAALTSAVEADPDFAEATTALAITQAALHEYSGEDREAGFAVAAPLARRAMTLDPKLGKPHAVLGYMDMRRWKWSSADEHFRKALALEDGEPVIHQWYSNLLNDLGYRENAVSHALAAYQMDRLSPQANNILALNFVMLGRDDAARKHVAVAREFGLGGPVPDYVDYFVHLRQGRFDDAAGIMTACLKRSRAGTEWVEPTVAALADPGVVDGARAALARALEQETISVGMAHMQYILLCQADETFSLAEAQLDGHRLTHLWLLLPEAEPLRDDPRFVALMERMGIVEHWEKNGWPAVTAGLRTRHARAG